MESAHCTSYQDLSAKGSLCDKVGREPMDRGSCATFCRRQQDWEETSFVVNGLSNNKVGLPLWS